MLTVITYHYVRDVAGTRFPGLKARAVADFRGQLDYLERHYALVAPAAVLAALAGAAPLPPRAALLTFDDGLVDHYETVAPTLIERGLAALFFPASRPLTHGVVLEAHKLHFVLAATPEPDSLALRLDGLIEAAPARWGLESPAAYRARYAGASRYDSPAVAYVKRMLQKGLAAPLCTEIIDGLFRERVTGDERGFAESLYAGRAQLAEMRAAGLAIGGHGARHVWLDSLAAAALRTEIDETRAFLDSLGVAPEGWSFSYPYGGHAATTREALRVAGCAAGFSVVPELVDLGACDPLALPRLDTNDLPLRPDAAPADWTLRAAQTVAG